MLITKCEGVGLKHCNDSKAFTEYSNDMQEMFKSIEEYRPIFIFFVDAIAYMLNNKKTSTNNSTIIY